MRSREQIVKEERLYRYAGAYLASSHRWERAAVWLLSCGSCGTIWCIFYATITPLAINTRYLVAGILLCGGGLLCHRFASVLSGDALRHLATIDAMQGGERYSK